MRTLDTPEPSKSGATRRTTNCNAKPASSRLCTGRCCGVSWLAPTKHNGLLHVVWPVATVPFAWWPHCTQRPLCLAPTSHLRPCGQRSLRVEPAKGPTTIACGVTASRHPKCFSQALARTCGVDPRPPCGPGAVAPRPRRWVARPPPKGAPSTPALCAAGQRGACAASVGHGSLAHRRNSSPAHLPHPSLVARVQQRRQAVKAACRAACWRWPAASLDSLSALLPVSLMRARR